MRQQHKHYSCIRAFADGWEIIQYMPIQKKWITVANPNFSPEFMFHVVPDENGWLPWYGGECPVAAGTVVEVIYKGGPTIIMVQAHFIRWGHADKIRDIIAYRVIKEAETDPYAELKAAAKDPTKQIRCGKNGTWADAGTAWAWERPVQDYEIRDKPKKMKLLAYIDEVSGELLWRLEGHNVSSYWKRVPSEDKEVEIEP